MQIKIQTEYKIIKKRNHIRKIPIKIYSLINTNRHGVCSVHNINYKSDDTRKRVMPYYGIRFESSRPVKYIKEIDLKYSCVVNHVSFRATSDILDDLSNGRRVDGLKERGFAVSMRRSSDMKISRLNSNWTYVTNIVRYTPTSKKSFIRWCKNQSVPEGTVFVLESSMVKGKDIRYTYKLSKKKDLNCRILRCVECTSPKTIRNLSYSYNTLRCAINHRIVYRDDVGIL